MVLETIMNYVNNDNKAEEDEEEIKSMVTVFSNSKTISSSFGILSHHYLTIPSMDLEIHPGKYYQGTHHTLGTFNKNSTKTGQYELCQNCFKNFMDEATSLQDAWYYPVINCETLTKGLLQNNGMFSKNCIIISIQALISIGFIMACLLSLISNFMFIIALLSILLLIVLNNFCLSYKIEYCIHLNSVSTPQLERI